MGSGGGGRVGCGGRQAAGHPVDAHQGLCIMAAWCNFQNSVVVAAGAN